MKKIPYLLLVLLFCFCGRQKGILDNTHPTTVELKQNCPTNGTCTLEVLKEKSLQIRQDEFGKTYYELADSKTSYVLLYRYKKFSREDVKDGEYTEEIIVEIDNSAEHLSLVNEELQHIKMLYGRLCFCRGLTGYYPIKEGSFKYDKTDEVQFDLNFKVHEVPQVIQTISGTLK